MLTWRTYADDDFDTAITSAMPDMLAMLDAAQYATARDATRATAASM